MTKGKPSEARKLHVNSFDRSDLIDGLFSLFTLCCACPVCQYPKCTGHRKKSGTPGPATEASGYMACYNHSLFNFAHVWRKYPEIGKKVIFTHKNNSTAHNLLYQEARYGRSLTCFCFLTCFVFFVWREISKFQNFINAAVLRNAHHSGNCFLHRSTISMPRWCPTLLVNLCFWTSRTLGSAAG